MNADSTVPSVSRPSGRLEVLLAAGFALAYSLYGIVRHRHYGSNAYDLAIFDQAIWHLSRFEAPASTVGAYPNLFGDHFHPIIALWVPVFMLVPLADTLIAAQAVLLAASILPVLAFARSRLPERPAWTIAVAYGLFWPIQQTMAFDVHEYAFAPLIIGLGIIAADRERWRPFWGWMFALVLVKEDLIPLVGGFGLWLLARRETRRGLTAILASIVAFAAVLWVVVPAFSASGRYTYLATASDLTINPWRAPLMLVTPVVKLRTALLWLGPFLFLPLASPVAIMLPVLVAERFLSRSPNHWQAIYHYSAPLAPILAMSAADGLARLTRRVATRWSAHAAVSTARMATSLMLLLAAFLPGRQPIWRVFAPAHYRAHTLDTEGDAALALIPPTASVAAQSPLTPHLSHRERIYLLTTDLVDAEYVVTARHLNAWPAASIDALLENTSRHLQSTHAIVFDRNGWTVWRRMSAKERESAAAAIGE